MHTETTPNPLALKFVLHMPAVVEGDHIFSSEKEALAFPVLAEILSLPGVHSVFLNTSFLTITKAPQVSWALLESVILSILHHHQKDFPLSLSLGQPSFSAPQTSEFVNWLPETEEIRAICQEIEDLLDGHIRPMIAEDGGAVSLVAFKEGIAYVHLKGACEGCGHAGDTLKQGIEQTLRYYIPEILGVEAVN